MLDLSDLLQKSDWSRAPVVPTALHFHKQSPRSSPEAEAHHQSLLWLLRSPLSVRCRLCSHVGFWHLRCNRWWDSAVRRGGYVIFFLSYWRTRKNISQLRPSVPWGFGLFIALFVHWSNRTAEEVLGWVALLSQPVTGQSKSRKLVLHLQRTPKDNLKSHGPTFWSEDNKGQIVLLPFMEERSLCPGSRLKDVWIL